MKFKLCIKKKLLRCFDDPGDDQQSKKTTLQRNTALKGLSKILIVQLKRFNNDGEREDETVRLKKNLTLQVADQ